MVKMETKKIYADFHIRFIDDETGNLISRCLVETVLYAQELILWNVLVNPIHRNQGYGTKMVQEAINYYKTYLKNHKRDYKLVLFVEKRNEAAIHLYKKNDFKIVGDYTKDSYVMEYCA